MLDVLRHRLLEPGLDQMAAIGPSKLVDEHDIRRAGAMLGTDALGAFTESMSPVREVQRLRAEHVATPQRGPRSAKVCRRVRHSEMPQACALLLDGSPSE